MIESVSIYISICFVISISLELITGNFILWRNPHKFCGNSLFGSNNPRLVRFRGDAITFGASQLWQKVPMKVKDSPLPEIFKAKIKLSNFDACPSNLCKRFITAVQCA